MENTLRFTELTPYLPQLVQGTLTTLRLAALAMVLGLAVACFNAFLRSIGLLWVNAAIRAYVEFVRNTPLLVQAYLIFFGLPTLGVRFSAETAALIALTFNVGAYVTEVLRAGIEGVPRGQSEAGAALGLSRTFVFSRIVLPQALVIMYPAICTQFILTLLATSIMSAISAPELTAIANNIQSMTFRSFETYIVIAVLYMAMTVGFFLVFEIIARKALGTTLIGRVRLR